MTKLSKEWASRFAQAAHRLRASGPTEGIHPDLHKAQIEAAESMAHELLVDQWWVRLASTWPRDEATGHEVVHITRKELTEAMTDAAALAQKKEHSGALTKPKGSKPGRI